MPFTTAEFHDLVRLVEEHPEWRAELRRLVLTDALLALPQQVAELRVETERRFQELAAAQQRTEARMAELAEVQRRHSEQIAELTVAQRRTAEQLASLTQQVVELIRVVQS
jgi:DNA repair ATPase RecN